MVDAINEPVVLENVEQQVAFLVLAIRFPSDLNDALAALIVNDKTSILLLDVLGQL